MGAFYLVVGVGQLSAGSRYTTPYTLLSFFGYTYSRYRCGDGACKERRGASAYGHRPCMTVRPAASPASRPLSG